LFQAQTLCILFQNFSCTYILRPKLYIIVLFKCSGFTTGIPTNPDDRRYTEDQVEAMYQAIQRNQFLGKKITYPVRAILVGAYAHR
jgi:hypothetical protein